jgi:hypothetical protein
LCVETLGRVFVSCREDRNALQARWRSPADIVSALQASNVSVPAKTARIGTVEYNVLTDLIPALIQVFKSVSDFPVFLILDTIDCRG